jgi:hypothetical protein
MDVNKKADAGIAKLVQKCRHQFRRSENTDFYAEDDLREAERKYVKFCLLAQPNV